MLLIWQAFMQSGRVLGFPQLEFTLQNFSLGIVFYYQMIKNQKFVTQNLSQKFLYETLSWQ